jgi:hypothetical protein
MESDPTDDQQPLTDEQDFREEHIRYLEDQARDLQRNSNVLRLKLGLPFDFDSWGEIEMQQQGRFERKAFRDRVEAHWIVEFDSRENAKGYPKPLLICLTTSTWMRLSSGTKICFPHGWTRSGSGLPKLGLRRRC